MSNDNLNLIEWAVSTKPVEYSTAINVMEGRVKNIYNSSERELVWLLEHPSMFTAGTSARDFELIDRNKFPIHSTGRGGRYTYHGPGQQVIYLMLNLKRYKTDIKFYIENLEKWLINSLLELKIPAQ
mgnify:FL=1